MTSQLKPCNKCWSEAVIIADEYHVQVKCKCGNETTDIMVGVKGITFRYARAYAIYYWNAANPISHAGKYLLEKAVERAVTHDIPTSYIDICQGCAQGRQARMIPFDSSETKVDSMLKIKHSPTCTLITEARLPLKTKGESDGHK